MIFIEDENHAEQDGPYESFAAAEAELKRRVLMDWDEPPNRVPCMSWKTCGREYWVVEYLERPGAWTRQKRAHVLSVSSSGARWIDGYRLAWEGSAQNAE